MLDAPVVAAVPGVLPPGFLPRGCTFQPGDWEILARHWYPVARAEDIGEAPVAVTLLDLDLVVYRAGDRIVIGRDLCPHRGVPLSMGWVEGEEIVCAYHGLRFGPSGRCTKIPAHPEAVPSPKFRVTTFPVMERYGLVWTCLRPGEGSVEPAPLPEWADDSYQHILVPQFDIAGAPGRQVEGFIDVAHFAWVHHETFADRDRPEVPSYKTKFTDYGLRTDYWSDISNFPKDLQHLAPPGFQWLRQFDVFPPFVATLRIFFPGDDRLVIMNCASPVSARKTRLFVPICRNFDKSGSVEDVHEFNRRVFTEDAALVERQRPEDLPLDMQEEAHFNADKSSTGYRRLLKEMGLTLAYAG